MDEIDEMLEQSIRRSNDLIKSTKHKMEIKERNLRIKEKIHLHGLYVFLGKNPEVANSAIYKTLKTHPFKFWLLNDLCHEYPYLIEDLREHGFVYVCKNMDKKRSLHTEKQEDTI